MKLLSLLLITPVLCQSSSTEVETSTETVYQWDATWNKDIQIHSSCNYSQYHQIYEAWEETKKLSNHAKEHASLFGNSSEIFQKWFGIETSNAEVVGWYDNVLNQDKTGVIFRCDDIDGNCHQDGWAGHWRGENGTDETVICDLSYTSRLRLTQLCTQGWTVSGGSTAIYWSGDFLHRIWHTATIGQGVVDHYADTYEECLELAETDPDEAVRNSATLRYFALEVYAYDIAVPGEGCVGEEEEEEEETASTASTGSEESSTSTTAGTECHTHSDGEVHCS